MADTKVGELVVDILGDTSGFSKSIEESLGGLASFATAAAALGAAAAAGLGVAVKASIDAADGLDDLSKQTGVTVETLSALGHAASMGGGDLNTLTSAFQTLNKNANLAAVGSEKQVKAFEQIGVSVRDAGGQVKSTETLFREVVDAISKLPPGAEQAGAAMRLLGGAGAQLMPALADGAAGLDEMTAQAERMGLVVSGETAAAANELGDNVDLLGKTLDGAANAITKGIVPTLASLSGEAVSAAGGVLDLGRVTTVARAAAEGTELAIRGVRTELSLMVPETVRAASGLLSLERVKEIFVGIGLFAKAAVAPVRTVVEASSFMFDEIINGASALGSALVAIVSGDFSRLSGIADEFSAAVNSSARKSRENFKAIWGLGGFDPLDGVVEKVNSSSEKASAAAEAGGAKIVRHLTQGARTEFKASADSLTSSAFEMVDWDRVAAFWAEETPKAIAVGTANALRKQELYALETKKIYTESTKTRLDDLAVAEELELAQLAQQQAREEVSVAQAEERKAAIRERYAQQRSITAAAETKAALDETRHLADAAEAEQVRFGQAGLSLGFALTDGITGAMKARGGQDVVKSILTMIGGVLQVVGSFIPGAGAGISLLGTAFSGIGQRLAGGGPVGGVGGPTEDRNLAWLSRGEWVLDAATVDRVGSGFLRGLQAGHLPRFAAGGPVGEGAHSGGGINLTAHVVVHGNPTPAEYERITRDALRRSTDPLIRQLQAKGVIDPAWRG